MQASLGLGVSSGLAGGGCPFTYNQVGWYGSLFSKRSLLPQITSQPQNQTVSPGTVTLSVSVSNPGSTSYQWFKNGSLIIGANSASYSFTASSDPPTPHVVEVSNATGSLFSDKAVVSVYSNIGGGTGNTLAISSVSPSTLPTSSSAQPIKIIGSGFTSSSTLLFNGSIASDPTRLTFVSANEIDYNVIVQSTGSWSVQVVNGSQTSSPSYFTVNTPTANTGSLVVNLSPSGIGAQWQVNGTYYDSGSVIASLAPGQYTVSFKPVSGYTTPASFPVSIVANQQTTTNATYTAVAPTTYTLTLNAANGSISPSPLGTLSGGSYIYNAGQVVQLYAGAASGYHFTSWSGDASGTANPTTVTMTSAKNVTANFASGDPNLATVTVTIKPDPAANAGVTWSVTGDSQLRASGTSLSDAVGSGYTTYLPVTLNLVSGWLGTNGITSFLVPITAGTITNVTLICAPDTTPGLLTVALSPPDAVTAGAHWHVNGGAAQGNGTTLSLSAGNYNLTFDSVSGWTAPANQTVAVQRAQTTTINGNYTPPAGQPAIISISPPIGPNTGGTLMTINGVNFTAPATVLIGGQPATNVTVSSATQITCFTPASSNYGSTNVIVQTASGSATNSNGFSYGIANGNKLDLISSFGGSAFGVALKGNYAYVGEGRNLLVLDISTPSSPSRVGRVQLPGLIMDDATFGNYIYVADGDGGLQVLDISNPTVPVIRGFYSSTNLTFTSRIKIFGGTAYVANENDGLQIFDLSNPILPSLLSSTNFGGYADDLIIKATANGVFAYLTTDESLCIIDVSNPTSPVLRGQTTINGGSATSIAMVGNYVYAAAQYGNLEIIDVSNPESPVDVGHAPSMLYPACVAAANNFVYAVSQLNINGFDVFSVSGSTLTLVGHISNVTTSGYYTKMQISGNQVCIVGGASGFQVVDVSNPYNPTTSTPFTDSGMFGSFYYPVAVTGNSLCSSGGANLLVFDVSTPSHVTLAGQANAGSSQVLAQNGIAYLLNGSSNSIVNVSIPTSPQIIKAFANTGSPSIKMTLVGNTLYVVGINGTYPHFAAIDISTPSSPTVLGTKDITDLNSAASAGSIAVSGNKAIMGISPNSGIYQVMVLDISNLSAPIEQGSLTNVGNPVDIRMSADGNYAYVLDGNSPSFIHIVDVSNPAIPSLVTNLPLDISFGTSLEIQGNELYATTWRGLYVFNINSLVSPVLIRSYAMNETRHVCVPSDSASQSGNIYLSDVDGGVVALREEDIQVPDVFITNPTFSSIYTNKTSTVSLGGGSDDNIGVTAITWANNRGGSGQVSAPLDNWYVPSIALYPGTNLLTVTAYDAAGNAGTDTLAVVYQTAKQNQTITFQSITNHTFGDAPIPLVAAASSGLPVTFSVISGSASISSNLLTLTGAGAVTVEANQSGNDLFNPATPVDVSFNVASANQSITFAPLPDKSAGDAPFALTATTSSGLPVYFSILSGPAIINTNTLTLVGSGTVTVVAYQPGNSNYNAAATVQQSFNVSQIPQTITFGALSPQKVGDAPFPLNATADSGLPVNFSVSGPATLNGNIVTLAGHGTVNVTASQSGNNSYAAATPVIQSFFVAPPDNTLIALGFQNRSFQMAFYGMSGSNYTVQASSNLLNWQPFTNFILTDSPQYFSDPAATNFNRRFYRVTP